MDCPAAEVTEATEATVAVDNDDNTSLSQDEKLADDSSNIEDIPPLTEDGKIEEKTDDESTVPQEEVVTIQPLESEDVD